MTKSMAPDHAADNININSVCPGSVETGLTRMTFADPVLRQRSQRTYLGTLRQTQRVHLRSCFSHLMSCYLPAPRSRDGGLTAQ